LGNPTTILVKLCKTVEFVKIMQLPLQKESHITIYGENSYDALLNHCDVLHTGLTLLVVKI